MCVKCLNPIVPSKSVHLKSSVFLTQFLCTISVRLPPSISGSPLADEGEDVAVKYYEAEEKIALRCKASGTPEPK